MYKDELFLKELSYIKDDKYKESLKLILKSLPDYWYKVEASSTGKYHPKYALGEGGLLRHSKAAMKIGYEILSNPIFGEKYTKKEIDLMLIGLLVHDGLKKGLIEERYTKFDHPIIMGKYIIDNKDKFLLSEEDALFLNDIIKTHMGPWTKDYNDIEVLERPKNKYQNFVHMCDYLASRKAILLEFDKNNNIIN